VIDSIWIEAEERENGWDVDDDNSDVTVTFDSAQKWAASFFTYKNIDTLSRKNQKTGELLGGLYFCAADMILVRTLDRHTVEKVVADLLEAGEFEVFFKLIA